MTRVLSALVLLPVVFGTIWALPPLATLALAELVLVVAFYEYTGLATALGARVPTALVLVGALGVTAGVAFDVTAIVLIVRWIGGHGHVGHVGRDARTEEDRALAVLRERFARGEIDAEEYEARRRVLHG